jgi:hypothetical protein
MHSSDPLRHHAHYQKPGDSTSGHDSPYAGGSSFMERVPGPTRQMKRLPSTATELAQAQTDLLKRNTDLTEEIHALTRKVEELTVQVHSATCAPRTAA